MAGPFPSTPERVRVHDPVLRIIAFAAITASIGVHNRFALRDFTWPDFGLHAVILLGYAAVAWLLVRWFPSIEKPLLTADVVFMTYAVYASGGERSLLFFLPVLRVADQTHTSFRRATMLGHAALLAYAALFLGLATQRPLDVPRELTKFAVLWGSVLYIAAVARRSDSKRAKLQNAIQSARDVAAQLAAKSASLESSERELRALMLRNERILAAAGEGIVGVDAEGKIVFANERAAKVIGRPVAEVLGQRAHDLAVHVGRDGERCEGEDCDLARALVSAEERHGEHPGFFRPDGALVPVEYTTAPILDDGGALAGVVFSFRNISVRKKAEKQLVEAKVAAEEANLAKSRFLANMSHELRTPLNAIIGYSEMIADELREMDRDDLSRDAERIRSSGQHLLGLINDLLEIARIEAGRVDVTAEEFDLRNLAAEMEAAMRKEFEKRSNHLEVVCETGGTMHGDVVKVRRILGNLLSNANKFTEQGAVTLRIRRNEPESIAFEVQDSGIGMTEEQLGRLFQPFRQADISATRKYGGTGLGLAIARGLARLMGGECAAVSRPGEGSTFTVNLPAVVAGAGAEKGADA